METWTVIRLLHLLAMAFFVGGQLVVASAMVPATRAPEHAAVRAAMARRFGIGSAAALAVLVGTGIAMAGHFGRWDDGVLHAKLAVLVLVGVLTALHVRSPGARGLAPALLVASLGVVWLGVALAH